MAAEGGLQLGARIRKAGLRAHLPGSALPAVRVRGTTHNYVALTHRGENLGIDLGTNATWYDGKGLYPLQAMVQPIALRFKYHFQGSRNTNRVDKASLVFQHRRVRRH